MQWKPPSWHRRVKWISGLDKPDQPLTIVEIPDFGKGCDQVDPGPPGVQGDGIVVRIQEIERTRKAALLFPFTVNGGPADGEILPIAKLISIAALACSEVYLELIVADAEMLCEDNNDIFKRLLAPGQPVRGGEEGAGSIRQVRPAEVT